MKHIVELFYRALEESSDVVVNAVLRMNYDIDNEIRDIIKPIDGKFSRVDALFVKNFWYKKWEDAGMILKIFYESKILELAKQFLVVKYYIKETE